MRPLAHSPERGARGFVPHAARVLTPDDQLKQADDLNAVWSANRDDAALGCGRTELGDGTHVCEQEDVLMTPGPYVFSMLLLKQGYLTCELLLASLMLATLTYVCLM